MKTIFSAEHYDNNIPNEFHSFFMDYNHVLNTHKGYDIGVNNLLCKINKKLKIPLFTAKYSRLLVDLNRSLKNRNLFSEITKNLSTHQKDYIINNYYSPYRNDVLNEIKKYVNQGNSVLHISFHSFTPVLNNKHRKTDVGILYDPKSSLEKETSLKLKKLFNENYKVRFNYPYKGTDDGFTTYLRTQFPPDVYIGIELEFNQKHLQNNYSSDCIADLVYKYFR